MKMKSEAPRDHHEEGSEPHHQGEWSQALESDLVFFAIWDLALPRDFLFVEYSFV